MSNESRRLRTGTVINAYRAAHARSATALAHDDGTWLDIGTLLEHAALVVDGERRVYLDPAAESVRAAIGDAKWRDGHYSDPVTPKSTLSLEGRLRVLCEVIEDDGAIELADALLAAYVLGDPTISPVEKARVEAVRGRLAWKAGDLDAAAERYRRVLKDAIRLRSHELRVRAWIGGAVVARLRGNYPEARRLATKAVHLAERRALKRLASVAHHSLMASAATAKKFDIALEHGWQAYTTADGDPGLEAGALGNMGQLFLDMGHLATAMSAFRAAVDRRPADRILLPALGGLAITAAHLGFADKVIAISETVVARTRESVAVYDIASAMLDIAKAFTLTGDSFQAEVYRREALAIGTLHGFHEFVLMAEQSAGMVLPVPPPRPLSPRVEVVAEDVRHLAYA